MRRAALRQHMTKQHGCQWDASTDQQVIEGHTRLHEWASRAEDRNHGSDDYSVEVREREPQSEIAVTLRPDQYELLRSVLWGVGMAYQAVDGGLTDGVLRMGDLPRDFADLMGAVSGARV